MLHIAYALSDKQGNYSKFAGASMASLLANTEAKISFHLLHDGSLAEDNRRRFAELVRGQGSVIHFYDVPRRAAATLELGREILPEGLDSERYTGANIYRLLLPEVLPPEAGKVIFLDADTIVNLDIRELWEKDTGEAGLAAVPDFDVLEHFGQSHKIKPNGSFLFEEGLADIHGIFNAGVLLLDLKILRRRENLLLEGLKFLRAHGGKWDFFDNDILIGFFAKSYIHLPWHFHIRLGWALAYGGNVVERGIYHYVDRNYSLNPKIPLHALFLHYLLSSPWGGPELLCSCCRAARETSLPLMQERLQKVRLIENACRRKRRVFMGLREDEARLREDFSLGREEAYLPLAPGQELRLPYSTEGHFYLVFWGNYGEVKGLLEGAGLREYEDFADGTLLMPERVEGLVAEDRVIVWRM